MLQHRATRLKKAALIGLASALALSVAACASERGQGGEGQVRGGTLTFGSAGDPKMFDATFATDGETFRPVRQMFDTLITYKQGSADLAPALATKWEPVDDGKGWKFTLREGVKFHDGTDFNADAVCFNFDRWYNMKGAAAQSQMIYYADVFGGFKNNTSEDFGEPLYAGCEKDGDYTVTIKLKRPSGAFPAAFGLTSLSIGSPTAMKKYNADEVKQSGEAFTYSEYATEHPTGTGPFKLESYDKSNGTVTMVRNEDYWGEKAYLDKLIFKTIPEEQARKDELRAGTIDGYDLPSPADYETLEKEGHQVMVRPVFNILYLGINQKNNPKLRDLKVREALEMAINKEQLAKTRLPKGAIPRDQFVPKDLPGYTEDVVKREYNPDEAKKVLNGLKVKFHIPTEVTRPYMPDPKTIAKSIISDLKAVGVEVQEVSKPWNGGYLDDVNVNGVHDLHLLGWTGDYGDAGNFIGTFFGRKKAEFGFTNDKIFDALAKADREPDPDKRGELYEQAAVEISKYVPAIPLTSSPPAIVVSKDVQGLVPSPLTDERFVTVSKKQSD
ncbi:ABC transporter substrate-binding protein [Thermocrispum municipale]|jgi:peptide/nickel transport system substrate-binding protein|uniref:ABC transporter substrate-binding protein n=1 Tax=Thermocrispum municipale TaxID=37926 RepID=UPI00048A5249|nr:ABC transporter substrate-binding protein [Thermocrispum municipale]